MSPRMRAAQGLSLRRGHASGPGPGWSVVRATCRPPRVQVDEGHHLQQIHGSARGSREADKVIAQIYRLPYFAYPEEKQFWASSQLIPAVQQAAGGIMLRRL